MAEPDFWLDQEKAQKKNKELASLEGKVKESAELQLKYLELINALFCEVNPVPVKTAMAEMGLCDIEMRLPLCEMEDATKARLVSALKKHGLL
jgi:4-hydroxy-tetrahydrodipicolinate synthase